MLKTKRSKIKWSTNDICSVISWSVNIKAYRYLRRVTQHPLPGLSTLRWVSTLQIQPGILEVLCVIKHQGNSFTFEQHLCVLTFDEMYVSNKICFDKKREMVVGPHRTVQVIIAKFSDDERKFMSEILVFVII